MMKWRVLVQKTMRSTIPTKRDGEAQPLRMVGYYNSVLISFWLRSSNCVTSGIS